MINYELLNQVLVLARALEVISLIACFAGIAFFAERAVEEIATFLRKKNVDKDNKK